jgi:flagellar hook-associated protein 3 FlgL
MLGNRVTNRMISDTALRGMQTNLTRNQQLQEQLSSGKLVSRPSDDPAAATNSMKLRSEQARDTQYLINIDDAAGRMNTAGDSLTTISSLINRAKELLVNANDQALPDASRSAITAELRSLRTGVIDQYNTRWLDRPVFGGTAQGNQAVQTDGTYVGNDLPTFSRIARQITMRTDVSGKEAGADTLPALMAKMADDIDSGSIDVDANQDALDSTLNKILTTLGDVGARAAQVANAKTAVTNENLDLTARISQNEDVDLPRAILDLQASSVAYQAALGAAGKVLQTSLLDYLR